MLLLTLPRSFVVLLLCIFLFVVWFFIYMSSSAVNFGPYVHRQCVKLVLEIHILLLWLAEMLVDSRSTACLLARSESQRFFRCFVLLQNL